MEMVIILARQINYDACLKVLEHNFSITFRRGLALTAIIKNSLV